MRTSPHVRYILPAALLLHGGADTHRVAAIQHPAPLPLTQLCMWISLARLKGVDPPAACMALSMTVNPRAHSMWTNNTTAKSV